ncbi:unnamed protein product [Rangifer tarandus platyrhynchus]|uniref:Uncharacterized protein n=1 Tax=Rangifer tarandus platyrhynchus TaxID=3082113 RepID=A0ACB1KHJ5_RANTA
MESCSVTDTLGGFFTSSATFWDDGEVNVCGSRTRRTAAVGCERSDAGGRMEKRNLNFAFTRFTFELASVAGECLTECCSSSCFIRLFSSEVLNVMVLKLSVCQKSKANAKLISLARWQDGVYRLLKLGERFLNEPSKHKSEDGDFTIHIVNIPQTPFKRVEGAFA